MAKLTQEQKDEKVAIMFASNPKIDTLHVTCDGHGFTTDTTADAHASGLPDKKVQVYERETKKPDAPELSAELQLGLKELKPALEEINDAEKLEALATEEEARGDEARKGAIKLIAERIEAITAEADKAKKVNVEGATDANGNAV